MKKLATAATLLLSLGTFGAVHAAEDCATKRAALERQISIAQQYGNSAKVAGLRKALAEVNAHCTSASVMADVQKDIRKLEKKLADKESDIRDVKADLRKAQAKSDVSKIRKYTTKLAEKQNELREIQQKLAKARAELAALKK